MNVVYREGDTVVRDAGPWTPTVHRYLDYLRLAGIDWVPRPVEVMLGANGEPERERLSYLPGDVPASPLPEWVWSDDVLRDGARRPRRLHDASIGFANDGAVWQSPVKIPAEVVCHNDLSPHNLVSETDGSWERSTSTSARPDHGCGTSPTSQPESCPWVRSRLRVLPGWARLAGGWS